MHRPAIKNISLLIARSLLKVSGDDEKKMLSEWKNISERNAAFVRGMEEYWNLPVEEKPNKNLALSRKRLFVRLTANESKSARRAPSYYLRKIAAILIFILSIAGLSTYIASETGLLSKNNWIVVSTEAGQQSKVALPDGSTVWLNAETEVKYHSEKKIRKVYLTGEAYFEVEHAPNHPFVVETGNAQIKVLGTKFNVSHYPDSKITEASLLAGKIVMSLPENREEVELKPGQKLTYNAKEHTVLKTTERVQNEILWREGVLVFTNESFNNLIPKLERYYAVKFIYEARVFDNIHYTGTIDNLSINKVLEFINLTIPINYEIDNKIIKLYSLRNTK